MTQDRGETGASGQVKHRAICTPCGFTGDWQSDIDVAETDVADHVRLTPGRPHSTSVQTKQ
jgi:hypothetical protein